MRVIKYVSCLLSPTFICKVPHRKQGQLLLSNERKLLLGCSTASKSQERETKPLATKKPKKPNRSGMLS